MKPLLFVKIIFIGTYYLNRIGYIFAVSVVLEILVFLYGSDGRCPCLDNRILFYSDIQNILPFWEGMASYHLGSYMWCLALVS